MEGIPAFLLRIKRKNTTLLLIVKRRGTGSSVRGLGGSRIKKNLPARANNPIHKIARSALHFAHANRQVKVRTLRSENRRGADLGKF
jgi:hypothetical protein